MIRRALTALPALALLIGGAWAGVPARATEPPIVRVGVVLDQPLLHIDSDDPIIAADSSTGNGTTLRGGPWIVRAVDQGMALGATTFGPVVRLTTRIGFVRVNGLGYRGIIELRRTPAARLTAINEVDLEGYLYGVIKGEMDPHWPQEAVKAQAVAARTLAVANLAVADPKYPGEGYTLRATTDSQVYLGVSGENPAAEAAVNATRGLIATYRGRPIFAAYHSNSGGHTEDSENVWGRAYPYLRGVPDPYALAAPSSQWAASVALPVVEAQLRDGGVQVAGLREVEPDRVTPWGRSVTVRLVEEGGRTLIINANQFRRLLGAEVIRSTMFTITRLGADLDFRGRGSGHGVGLDQWGARMLAQQGRSFEEILRYYYTGITIERRF